MTVAELIAELGKYPADMTVVIAKDAEGNYYSQLDQVSAEAWEPETTWSVIVYSDEDDTEGLPKGPVLWPTY